MTRTEALQAIYEAPYGQRLLARLSSDEQEQVRAFIRAHEHLAHLEFEYAANRWFLDGPKPRQWTIMVELVTGANSRAKGRQA